MQKSAQGEVCKQSRPQPLQKGPLQKKKTTAAQDTRNVAYHSIRFRSLVSPVFFNVKTMWN